MGRTWIAALKWVLGTQGNGLVKKWPGGPRASRTTPRVRPIQGRTLRELAYDELRRALLEGRFAPGDSITIADLSAQLGIGLMPTREAVQQLASRGAFEFLANRSVRVPLVEAENLASLFETRQLLEGFATARAAETITREEAAAVSANLEILEQRLQTRVAADCLQANYSFHFSIYQACRSPFVLEMIEHLWLRMSPLHLRVFESSVRQQDDFLTAMPLHRTLVEALKRRDSATAQATLGRMLSQSLQWHLRFAARET